MSRIFCCRAPLGRIVLAVACLTAVPGWCAEETPADDDLVQMIVGYVKGEDADERAIGLQFIREEAPGEAATKAFAALLPKLAPEAQAALTETLGDRGDAAAKPAVLQMLDSKEEAVRVAALRALGRLGGEADVPRLAAKTAAGAPAEREAARRSLVRLRGDGVNAALVAAVKGATAAVRAELLGILASRGAKDALPTVLNSAEDKDPTVRQAAIQALRFLADEKNTSALVAILKAASDDAQRTQAELALLAVCTRAREQCVPQVAAGLDGADAPARIALLHALARAGGAKSLERIAGSLEDDDPAVRDEAVRMLSRWPDVAVKPRLLKLAETSDSERHRVLAVRGLIRLAAAQGDRPADVEGLATAMKLARRSAEKRLALGALGKAASPEALAVVAPALDDKDLVETAAMAAVSIAEKTAKKDKDSVKAAMQKVLEAAKTERTREQAGKILKSL